MNLREKKEVSGTLNNSLLAAADSIQQHRASE